MSLLTHPVVPTSLLLTASNVFMTFAVLYMGQEIKLNYLYAGSACSGRYTSFSGVEASISITVLS
jgi:uncharacterized protein (DUF486 family)